MKVMQIHEDRYPKRCLESKKDLDRIANKPWKYNWYTLLKTRVDRLDYKHILKYEGQSWVIEEVTNIINKDNKIYFRDDQDKALILRYYPIYKYIKDLECRKGEKYIYLKMPVKVIRSIVQYILAGRKIFFLIKHRRSECNS